MKEYNIFFKDITAQKVGYLLDEVACKTFHHLPDPETSIPKDIKMSLFYIYSKDCLREEKNFDNTAFYYRIEWTIWLQKFITDFDPKVNTFKNCDWQVWIKCQNLSQSW